MNLDSDGGPVRIELNTEQQVVFLSVDRSPEKVVFPPTVTELDAADCNRLAELLHNCLGKGKACERKQIILDNPCTREQMWFSVCADVDAAGIMVVYFSHWTKQTDYELIVSRDDCMRLIDVFRTVEENHKN
jgi:hypothetical protein